MKAKQRHTFPCFCGLTHAYRAGEICLDTAPVLLKWYRGFSHFWALKNCSAPPRKYLASERLILSLPANQPPSAECFEVFSYKHYSHAHCYYLCILRSKQSSRGLFSQFENQKKAVFSKMKWKIFSLAACEKLKSPASMWQSSVIRKKAGRKQSDLQRAFSAHEWCGIRVSRLFFYFTYELGLTHRDEGSRKPVWFIN